MKNRDDLKILLAQFRLKEELRNSEKDFFNKYLNLHKGQLETFFALEGKINEDSLGDFDAVIFGGTGDYETREMSEKYPKALEDLKIILNYCRKTGTPLLSICLQTLPFISGAEIKTDERSQEVGSYKIFLTDDGKKDPLFCGVDECFYAQLGHKDHVCTLPNIDATLLAYSDLCPTQAYRVGKNEYFLQFHPEYDKEEIISRINYYNNNFKGKGYFTEEEYHKLVSSLKKTPQSTKILENFVNNIILG